MYLLTQTQSLRSVLAAQVQRLREEVRSGSLEPAALRLLHLCAFATAFEARVLLPPLAKHLQLADPAGTVGLFEQEYLLRAAADGAIVEALHPVRSAILAGILADPAFSVPEDIALEVRPFVPEKDLEVFLLYLLSRHPECWEKLAADLADSHLETWSGAAGVGRALLWWGIRCYLMENDPVLADYAEIPGGSKGLLLILPDLCGACVTNPLEYLLQLLDNQSPVGGQKIKSLLERLTPRERALEPLGAWLRQLTVEGKPASAQDWESLAELLFWAGHLGIHPPVSLSIADVPTTELPIDTVAKVCLALAKVDPVAYEMALPNSTERLREHFREQTVTPLLMDDGDQVTAHFVVPFEMVSRPGTERRKGLTPQQEILGRREPLKDYPKPEIEESNLANYLNEEAVKRAMLLHALFPGRSRYCTQGYGHDLGILGLEMPYDGTHKKASSAESVGEFAIREVAERMV